MGQGMSLTAKQSRFIDEYLKDFNATQAAIRAGYSKKTAHNAGWQNVRKCEIREVLDQHVEAMAVGRDERLQILAEIARGAMKESDRLSAVKQLGELAGDFVKKVEHSGKINVTELSDGELQAIIEG